MKFPKIKSWKTTLAGLVAVFPTVLQMFGVTVPPDVAVGVVSIAAGLGLTAAKDGDVTGGTRKQGDK